MMFLISCEGCGVVLNIANVAFPNRAETYKKDGSIDDSKAGWDGNDFVPKVFCPVCRGEILQPKQELD